MSKFGWLPFGGVSLSLLFMWSTFISFGNASELPVKTSGTHLPWHGALIRVLAIAVANMAEIPATVEGYPKELAFFLKANPLLCLTDASKTLSVLLPRGELSLEQRLSLKAADRFRHYDHKHLGWRFARILGTVSGGSGAVKIYACRGALFSKLVISCYILNFLTDELLILYVRFKIRSQRSNPESDASKGPQTNEPASEVTMSKLVRSAFYANAFWSIMLLYRGSAIIVSNDDSGLAAIGTFLIVPACLSLHWVVLNMFNPSELIKAEVGAFFSPLVMAWYCLPFSIMPWNIPFSDITYDIDRGWKILHLLMGLGALAHGYYTVSRSELWGLKTTPMALFPAYAYSILVLLNLVGYYTTVYDATQPSKSSWVSDWTL